jgi:CRP/FNR family transcriptional regulator
MDIKQLEKQEIFRFLRPDQINIISETSESIKYKAGDTVFFKGGKAEYFYIILSGQVALRMPGKEGVNILIDTLSVGAIFGSCISFEMDTHVLTAQCTEDTEILKIKSSVLKSLMDEEPHLGYAVQSQISQIYFKRYIETMKKLQAIVMNIPIELA